jgi:hypothetical protein
VLRELQEQAQKMSMGLQSKRGALAALGEEFPDEKMLEIFTELQSDAIDQGALDMIRARVDQAIVQETGMMPMSGAEPMMSAGGPGVNTASEGGDAGMNGPVGPPPPGTPGRPPVLDTPEYRDVMAQINRRVSSTVLTGMRLPSEPKG